MLKLEKTDLNSDLNKKLNVAHINLCTEAEGPYQRMAIWFQGCDILCDGCCNPELQPIRPAHLITVGNIVDIVGDAKARYGIEGVTFLGGEPTLQKNLVFLARKIRELGLGVILFTGRLIEDIEEPLIQAADLIVDGKFDIKLSDDKRNLIGSKNQTIHFITERYKGDTDWFFKSRNKIVEVNINDKQDIFFTGDVF